MGYYGGPNYGDELMLSLVLSYLEDREVYVLFEKRIYYRVRQWRGIHSLFFPVDQREIPAFARYFDELVVGGGAHLDDTNYSEGPIDRMFDTRRLMLDLSEAMIRCGKKVKWVGLSSNDRFRCEGYVDRLRAVVPGLSHCSLRDTHSLNVLKKHGVPCDKITLIHDIAMACRVKKRVVGMTLLPSDIALRAVAREMAAYAAKEQRRFHVCLLPFTGIRDMEMYTQIKNDLNDSHISCSIAPDCDDVETTLQLIRSCDFMVNMRYHAALLALRCGIPQVMICLDSHPHYSNKMTFLREEYGGADPPEMIDESTYRDGDLQRAVARRMPGDDETDALYQEADRQLRSILR